MPSDYDWPPSTNEIGRIHDADVVFCYQGHPYKQPWYPKDHPTVGIYVSQPSHCWRGLEDDGWPWAVDGEYQTRLYGEGAIPVPELIPLRHPWYQPAAKPEGVVRIVWSPTNTHLTGWDDKGYTATIQILEALATSGKAVEIDVIRNVPLEECLRRKASAHVAIDECVTGSFHGCSIEALALGALAVNNCDALCTQNIHRMTGGALHPFAVTPTEGLADALAEMVELGPEAMEQVGKACREWVLREWNPAEMIERNFKPLIERAMAKAAS